MGITTMMLTLVLWPFRAAVSLVSFVVSGILSLVLLPFKVAACIFRTGKKKVQFAVAWTEDKIRIVRQRKPFVYILPLPVQRSQEEVDGPGRRETESAQKNESINSIIQDLERLSNYESPVLSEKRQEGAKITQLTQQIKSIDKKSEEEKCQLLKLIHELQELATSENTPISKDTSSDDEVSELLADLNVLETYLTDFLHEQDPLKRSLIASSLETILEEDTSHEASPSYPGSPLLHPVNKALRKRHLPTTMEAAEATNSDSSTASVKEESDMESLINSLEQQQKFMQTQLDLQDVMDSLETMHTNIDTTSTSKPSPAMPKSRSSPATFTNKPIHATPTNNPAHATPTNKPTHATSTNNPTHATPTDPDTEQIYDSLMPIYSVPLKKSKGTPDQPAKATQDTPPKTIAQEQPETITQSPVLPIQDDIYDRIPAAEALPTTNETPPPVPARQSSLDGTTRTGSDGTSSNEYSPTVERKSRKHDTCSCRRCEDEERRRRHHSESDDQSCRCCHDDDYHRRRHSDGEHRRRHRKHSSRHHCRHCDHSPDCCSHRTRSRERKSSHRHRHRSPSDESRDYDHQGRSSGYESQESPKYSRKGSFSESEQSVPSTPKDGRKGLFGLFSKRTGSVNSLASTKSEL